MKKIYVLLWILCIIGSWSILPYIRYLDILPAAISTLQLFLLATIQSALLFALICWLSSKILPKTDLQPFSWENPLKRIVIPAILSGVLVGLALFFFDKTIFQSSLLSGKHPPFWAGAIASFYGAFNEEVLLRLFLFSSIYFLFQKSFKFKDRNRLYFLWIANILVSLIFGLGHLPAALKMTSPTAFEIFRILFLNGLAGIVFGYLYWSRGIWTAMAAHFVTDLMIHVLLI